MDLFSLFRVHNIVCQQLDWYGEVYDASGALYLVRLDQISGFSGLNVALLLRGGHDAFSEPFASSQNIAVATGFGLVLVRL